MNDPKGQFIYPTVLVLGLGLAVLLPLLRSSKSLLPGVRISLMLVGLLGVAWAACGILTDTSAIAARLPKDGTVVLYNIRRFLIGVTTGIFICLAVTGNLKWKRGRKAEEVRYL
jgi:hypothetical protein